MINNNKNNSIKTNKQLWQPPVITLMSLDLTETGLKGSEHKVHYPNYDVEYGAS
jgi:hypothetical protein